MRLVAGATTAVRRVLDLLLLALILVVLFGVVLGKLVPLTGRQTLIVGGPSMEPAIGLGSAVVIRPVEPSTLAIGDVVSLKPAPEGAVFTHRIVEVVDRPDGRWIRTKGDANATLDPTLVPAAQVLGRVELAIPLAGYLIALLSIPTGVLFLLGLAATLLACAWLLESLELEAADRRRAALARLAPAPAPASPTLALGEPIALRPPDPEPTAGRAGGTLGRLRLTTAPAGGPSLEAAQRLGVAEQIAASRDTRHRRARWQADAARRGSRGLD
jgi:signal peptidase